jgi:hypothetical protein
MQDAVCVVTWPVIVSRHTSLSVGIPIFFFEKKLLRETMQPMCVWFVNVLVQLLPIMTIHTPRGYALGRRLAAGSSKQGGGTGSREEGRS